MFNTKMKKILLAILTLVLVFSLLSLNTFAEDEKKVLVSDMANGANEMVTMVPTIGAIEGDEIPSVEDVQPEVKTDEEHISLDVLVEGLEGFSYKQVIMWAIGGLLIFLAIKKEMEPTLLLPRFSAVPFLNRFLTPERAVKNYNRSGKI